MTRRLDPGLIPEDPNLDFETSLWQAGSTIVAGIDEAGRGAWAGPVAAAAVILPQASPIEQQLAGVRDSKQLTPEQREILTPLIKKFSIDWGVGFASSDEIDRWGILQATRLAMQRAVNALSRPTSHLLIDALFLPEIPIPQTALIKGDQRSLSIAAASILAKTSRDAWMIASTQNYPQYAFDRHKGYGTALHQKRLAEFGPCAIHRHSFGPIELLDEERK